MMNGDEKLGRACPIRIPSPGDHLEYRHRLGEGQAKAIAVNAEQIERAINGADARIAFRPFGARAEGIVAEAELIGREIEALPTLRRERSSDLGLRWIGREIALIPADRASKWSACCDQVRL